MSKNPSPHKDTPHYITKLARQNRQDPTPQEEKLWSILSCRKLNGLKFRRQFPIGRYIVDFYNHENKLVIEVDGNVHEVQKEYDSNRDDYLQACGYVVLRVRNEDIDLGLVGEKILEKTRSENTRATIARSIKTRPLIPRRGTSGSRKSPCGGDLGGEHSGGEHERNEQFGTAYLRENVSEENVPGNKISGGPNSGYTLLETLVALSMLLIIAAPLLSGIFRNDHALDSERMITGISLLEQEARKITADPDEMLPVKKRIINGREWVITGAKTGSGIVQYHLEVALDNKKYGEIYFLQREKRSEK